MYSVSTYILKPQLLYYLYRFNSSQIGHCSSRDSFKKQQNLQKAMEQAKKIVLRTPLASPCTTSPTALPDITGSNIINIIEDITRETEGMINNML